MDDTAARGAAELDALFDENPDSIVQIDAEGRCRRINRATTLLLGYSADEMIGRTPYDFTVPDYSAIAKDNVRRAGTGEIVEYRARYRHRDGSTIDVVGRTLPIRVGGRSDGFFAVSRDVTHDRDMSLSLDAHAARLESLARLVVAEADGVERRSEAALLLIAQHLRADVGALVTRYRTTPVIRYRVDATSAARVPLELDLSLVADRYDGVSWSVATASRGGVAYVTMPVDLDGRRLGVIAFAGRDLRAVTGADAALLRLTGGVMAAAVRGAVTGNGDFLYDPLTGAFGRALLFDRLDGAVAAWRRYKHAFAVHVLDLERWSAYVAQHGAPSSDDALRAIGTRLRSLIRETDGLARIGNGRFAIVQTSAEDEVAVTSFGARVRDAVVRAAPIAVRHGSARCPEDGDEPRALLQLAETRARSA